MIRCNLKLHDIGNTCPICGEQALDSAFDEHRDGKHEDTFKCDNCGVLVTYISPDDGRGEYHQFHDGEITVEFEWPFGHSNPADEEFPESEKRTGFYMDVDGVTAHVQGDPNMSDAEIAMLENIIRAAAKQVDSDNPSSQTKE